MDSKLYHEHSHLESSPWSPHGSDEGPAVLFGVVTLHSPQTLFSVVASCRDIEMHQGYSGALWFYLFPYNIFYITTICIFKTSSIIYPWSASQKQFKSHKDQVCVIPSAINAFTKETECLKVSLSLKIEPRE